MNKKFLLIILIAISFYKITCSEKLDLIDIGSTAAFGLGASYCHFRAANEQNITSTSSWNMAGVGLTFLAAKAVNKQLVFLHFLPIPLNPYIFYLTTTEKTLTDTLKGSLILGGGIYASSKLVPVINQAIKKNKLELLFTKANILPGLAATIAIGTAAYTLINK